MKQIFIAIGCAVLVMTALVMTNQPTDWVTADNLSDLSRMGNEAYEAGDFASASQAYQQLVDQGIEHSDLFYNLGNAYFKQGDIGRAILNYRRALRLTPREADIQANLALAQQQTTDQLDVSGESIMNRVASLSQGWVTLNELALVALGLWFLLTILVLAYSQSRTERIQELIQYGAFLVTFLFAINLFALGSRLYIAQNQPAGVIVADKVDVSSGPGQAQYITEFTLHSGTEIRMLEERDEWIRIALPGDQLQGWVPVTVVGRVELDRF